jgi:hypothetical protein
MNKEQLKDLIKLEGDEKDFKYTCKNGITFSCSIIRTSLLHLCGYVHITKDNKCWGVDYDYLPDISVHGGISYTGHFFNNNKEIWTIGFDCAHYRDLSPYSYLVEDKGYQLNFTPISNKDKYRDMDYVTTEIENLAEQLSEFSISIKRVEKIEQII